MISPDEMDDPPVVHMLSPVESEDPPAAALPMGGEPSPVPMGGAPPPPPAAASSASAVSSESEPPESSSASSGGGGVRGGGAALMPSEPPPPPPQAKDPWSAMVAAAGGDGGGGGGALGAYERVEVTDPQQHGEGRSAYTVYHLVVRSSSPDTKPTEVNRRYSDFQWLYRRFLKEKQGAIVPIIPHKSALTQESRFSEEVISFRRTSCEVWANRVIRHPELHGSPSLAAFLKSEDELFASAKRSGDVDFSDHGDEQTEDPAAAAERMEWGGTSSPKPGPGKDRFRRIKALATKVKATVRKDSELERTDDEPAFDEIGDYVVDLDTQIGWLAKHAAALVRTYKDQHAVLESLGNKFAALGALSYPNTHSSNSARLSTLLNKIGDGLSALGLNEIKRHDELAERFEQPVQDLTRDVQSLKIALQQRHEVQLRYTGKMNKVKARTQALETIRDSPWASESSQEAREKDAEGALIEAKESADAKKEEFLAVSSRVLREVERFRTQFRDSVRAVVREWATVQQEYYARANGGWGDILPFLDAPELVAGDAGGGYTLSAQRGQNGGPRLDSV